MDSLKSMRALSEQFLFADVTMFVANITEQLRENEVNSEKKKQEYSCGK